MDTNDLNHQQSPIPVLWHIGTKNNVKYGGCDQYCVKRGFLADLGKARGCSTNTFVIHSLIQSLIHLIIL